MNRKTSFFIWGFAVLLFSTTNIMAANLTFSQNSVNLPSGQSTAITVTGGSDYYALSNSNTSAVTLSISGSSIILNGVNVGTATISICSATGNNACGTVTVNVSGSGGGAPSTSPTLSPNSLVMTTGGTQAVSITGAGSYFISNNSNSSVISATLNGNIISVTALSVGSATLTVCQTGGCATLPVTVNNAGGNTGGALVFSQSAPSITVGQTITISVSGGTGIYSLSLISDPNVASSSLSGNALTVSGLAAGPSTITICESGGSCGSISVKVNSVIISPPVNTATTSVAATTTASNIVSIVVPANLNLSTDILSNLFNQIKAMENQIAQLTVQLSQLKSAIQILANSKSVSMRDKGTANNVYKFVLPLSLGDFGAEVKELQKRLASEGLFSDQIDGYFGLATWQAVKTYQKSHGLFPLGNVGPGTRAALNK